MNHDEKTQVVKSLLKAYKTQAITDQTQLLETPSRHQVKTLLNHIKNILFPGFFIQQSIEESELCLSTIETIGHIESTLTDLIKKSFSWDLNIIRQPGEAEKITENVIKFLPELRKLTLEDAKAIFEGDPAAKSIPEIILAYPGLHAMLIYRMANNLYKQNIQIIPRLMSEIAHSQTGIDIHPGATIGRSMFIDHGTGIVIGETAIIGNYVKLYQGVTLGAFSVSKNTQGRRHPKLGDHVTVYARSTILGGETEIGDHCVIGGNVWLTQSLPPKTTIYLSSDFKQIIKEQKN